MTRVNPILDQELDSYDPLDDRDPSDTQSQLDQEFQPLLEELERPEDPQILRADELAQELQQQPEPDIRLPTLEPPPQAQTDQQLEQPPEPEPQKPEEVQPVSALVQQPLVYEHGGLRTRRGALREGTGVG